MPDETNNAMQEAAETLKATMGTLDAEVERLTVELAGAKARKKAVAKAYEAMTSEPKPRRRRRRTAA